MKIGSFSTYNLICLIVFILLTPKLHAQGNSNGNGADPFALTVTTSGPGSLNFGSFVNVSGGTIEIDPFSPNSIPIANPGDFIVIRNGTGPILFEVSNQATPLKVVNLTYQVTPLSDGLNNLGLTVKFNSSRPLTLTSPSSYNFTINELYPAKIYMGGILTVAPGDVPGNYSGTISVTIDYP